MVKARASRRSYSAGMRTLVSGLLVLVGCKGADVCSDHDLQVTVTLTGPATYCDALAPADLWTDVRIRDTDFTDDDARFLSADHRTLVFALPAWVNNNEQGSVGVNGWDPGLTVELVGQEVFFRTDLSQCTDVSITATCQAYYHPDAGP